MPIDRDLIAAVAREFHGRAAIDQKTLEETAQRVNSFAHKVRLTDERALQAVAPAFSFDPGAAAYRTAPQLDEAPWRAIAGSPGGSGYGDTRGTTGVTAPPPVTATQTGTSSPAFLQWPAVTLAAAIRRRELSPVEVTRAALERLAAVDGAMNAFVTVTADAAMAQAREAETALARHDAPLGPLHGVPVALKDLIETAGVRTTAGSKILGGYVPQSTATCAARMAAAGAIMIGKTATHEFAFGITTDSPYHGPTHNPWHLDHVPGGSSGGSGAAVAACVVPLALGTDTGGSIRIPASVCGIVGLKPTYGRVSKAGVLPLSWSLDHVGPIARSVADCALALGVLAGPDPLDPTALPVPVEDYLAAASNFPANLRGTRIGLPAGWMETPIDPDVLALYESGVKVLRDLGAEVVEVPFVPADVMTFVNRLITLAEAGAYHAVTMRDGDAADYAPDVRGRLELGQYVSARDYLVGQRLRAEIARQVHQVMAQVDALVTPTVPIPAARIGQGLWEFPNGYREPMAEATVRFPAPFSVTGQPAFSLPCGRTPAGLPVGLQLVGRVFGETALIRIAAAYEAAIGPLAHPPI